LAGGIERGPVYSVIPTFRDGLGLNARFYSPRGLAIDSKGRIYVADAGSIRRVSPEGQVETLYHPSSGLGVLAGPGPVGEANLGVAIGPDDSVYFTDVGIQVIKRIAPDGQVSTFAGIPHSNHLPLADGPRLSAVFYQPTGLAVGNDGAVYVADASSVIRVIRDGIVVTLAGGELAGGQPGFQDGPGKSARFHSPGALALDGSGNLWIADTGNNAIRKLSPEGDVTTIAGGKYSSDFGVVDGVGRGARFDAPAAIVVSSSGDMYVSDFSNNRIRKVSPAGVVSTIAGSGPPRVGGYEDGDVLTARMTEPWGLVIDGKGRLVVADYYQLLLRVVAPCR
jgi:sugar lactone lactonase YvrE